MLEVIVVLYLIFVSVYQPCKLYIYRWTEDETSHNWRPGNEKSLYHLRPFITGMSDVVHMLYRAVISVILL